MAMDLEGTEAPSDASLDPESPQALFEESAGRDICATLPELTDSIMSDGEQTLSDSEAAHTMEPTDTVMINAPSTETASPEVFDRGINMDDGEDGKNPQPLEQATMDVVRPTQDSPASDERILDTNPGRNSAPVISVSTASSELPPPPAQSLPNSRLHKAEGPSSVADGDRDMEPVPTQGLVSLIKSTQTAPASSPAAISSSTVAVQVPVPSTPAMKSTAGPSTTTPTSPLRTPTRAQDQVPNAHASRVHQVLARFRVSKPASKSTQRSINDETSEEAEAAAYLARIASHREPPKPQDKPSHPPPQSHPKQTKGSASRSLMDNLMAGFGSHLRSPPTPSIPHKPSNQPTEPPIPSSQV
ncbi:hypothetical protein M407DRAFT_19520 [Tulasnella calospora MUT 4182]|uniref:Uncharacterized protein n=1 Tax=Tulasnella calospora MUT 4182 TaxID=1051891 RepID=A0A0C3QTB0_9AGAM|nr:hypothetical protein M407DRAFT_19520 [Tulasnella calospora MUT 4182]